MKNNSFVLSLEPDYCCGGGHCGILPGYTYTCPKCGKATGCRTGDYLKIGEHLTCFLCKKKIQAVEEIDDFTFRFHYID